MTQPTALPSVCSEGGQWLLQTQFVCLALSDTFSKGRFKWSHHFPSPGFLCKTLSPNSEVSDSALGDLQKSPKKEPRLEFFHSSFQIQEFYTARKGLRSISPPVLSRTTRGEPRDALPAQSPPLGELHTSHRQAPPVTGTPPHVTPPLRKQSQSETCGIKWLSGDASSFTEKT